MSTPKPLCDSIPLMRQLAAMANMDMAPIKKMVLVLSVDDVPTLFVESFLDQNKEEELQPTELVVKEEPYYVDTTSMQNEKYRTREPK